MLFNNLGRSSVFVLSRYKEILLWYSLGRDTACPFKQNWLQPRKSVQVESKFNKSEHSLHSLQWISFSGVVQQREKHRADSGFICM